MRARGEQLAREKKLINTAVGQAGVTPAFLADAWDALAKHELLRVKLGEGCGLSRSQGAALMEAYLDCAVVHEIGFTLTLYRRRGLPRPSNIPERPNGGAAAAAVAEAAAAAAAEEAAAAALRPRPNSARAQVKAHKARQRGVPRAPDEFQVLS